MKELEDLDDLAENSFMKPQIVKAKWTIIDTSSGMWAVQSEYTPLTVAAFADDSVENIFDVDGVESELLEYAESTKDDLLSAELKDGYGARLSATGYLDCTPC